MSGYKVVSSIEKIEALGFILPSRPAGRNIIDYAREEIERLRSELHDATDAAAKAFAENERLRAERGAMKAALKSTGLFLRHCWRDLPMSEDWFDKMNEQMEIVDEALRGEGE